MKKTIVSSTKKELNTKNSAGDAAGSGFSAHKIPKYPPNEYSSLLNQISSAYSEHKSKATHAVNTELVKAYWETGKYIVEFELDGENRAKYGDALLKNLAKDLTLRNGRGFTYVNVYNMKRFYKTFPIFQAVPEKLS
jgi:hypothetical protein